MGLDQLVKISQYHVDGIVADRRLSGSILVKSRPGNEEVFPGGIGWKT